MASGPEVGNETSPERLVAELRRLLETAEAKVSGSAHTAAASADKTVREHPWTMIGAGAAIGVVLGILLHASIARR